MPGSPARGTPDPVRSARWRRATGWLPVALLLAGVTNHFWQARQHQISPWLGAGFGMFATTDMPSARSLHVIARLADGSEREVALGKAYQDTLKRARALPSEAWLERAAESAFQALAAAPEIEYPAAPEALRIEVWRTSFEVDTARPVADLIASRTWPFPADDH